MTKRTYHFLLFVLALTLSSHVWAESLGYYLFQKSIADRSFFEPRKDGESKVFNRISNDYYTGGLKLDNRTGNIELRFKNKNMLSATFEFDRPDIRKSNRGFFLFSFPYFYNLLDVTLEKNANYRKLPMHFITRWLIRIKKDSFETRRKRVLALYTDEFFSKSVVLWHQDCWPRLSQMTAEELKENVFLFTSFDFPLELEETNQPLNSTTNPFIELTAEDVTKLKHLHGTLEKVQPGVTKRPEAEWNYWTGRPLGTPEFKGEIILDTQTGFLSVNLTHPTPDVTKASSVRVNLDKNFGSQNNPDHFRNRFTAKTSGGQEFSSKNNETVSETSGVNRNFDLEDNESVGKECKLWEIAIWPELLDSAKRNSGQKMTLQYPIDVELLGIFDDVALNEEGFSIVPHNENLEMEIDSRAILEMEMLRLDESIGARIDEKGELLATGFRVWQTEDKMLRVTAKFVSYDEKTKDITLVKEDGSQMTIELSAFRKEDQEYVKRQRECETKKASSDKAKS